MPSRFNNDLYVSGSGGILGYAMGQNVLTLPAWQTLTAGDAGSISSNPMFLNPDGDAVTGDLHIGPISPIEAAGAGYIVNGFTVKDFDDQVRSSLTAHDIGADAVVTQAQAPQLPEIVLTGNGQLIADGDTVPSSVDGTNFGAGFCDALQPRVFVLQNTGAAPLLISSFGFTGPGAAQFSVVVPPPGVIAPGQSATFTLALTASVTGPASAQFNLSCNDWDETFYNFAVQGSSLGDTAAPVAVCQALNLYVGSGGSVTASPSALAAGSTDNCAIASFTASPSTFTCNQLGPRAVVVQVTDYVGQSDACSTTVMVLDTTRPSATCSAPILLLNANGQAVLAATAVNNNSTDNCAIDSLWASATQFDCSDLGANAVTLSVRDASGNVGTCTAQVTVLDLMAPTVVCQPVALVLDPSGQASLSPTAVELSSSDNCGVVGRSLSTSQFTCAQVGSNTVTLTVVDASGNASTCQAQISVSETLPPAITCTSANLYLNASGQASLQPSAVASATDNCGSVALTLSQSQFTCAQVGPQVLTATALDPSSNSATCTASILVQDTLAPVLTCQNTSVSVGTSGSTAISMAAVLASSSDNCGIDTLFLSRNSVSCADAGVVPVLVSAVDIHGNLATCTAQVTVQAVPLTASLVQPATNACGHHLPCAGMTLDSVHALASGGCTPYTYTWSNGQTGASATGLGAGVHSVTVTDGTGATFVQSIQLSAPAALSASLVIAQVPCGQDSTGVLSVSGSGGNACQPYNYLWSNGGAGASVAGLVAGTYQVTVTDVAGCMDSSSIVLSALQVPQPTVSQSQDTLFAGPAFFSYQWSLNGQPISGATGSFHVPTADGLYAVTVTDSNGCAGTSLGYPYTAVGHQAGFSAGLGLQVFPNPNDGRFVLLRTRAIDLPVRLTLIDLSGRELVAWDFPGLATRSALEAGGLAAGCYLLRVEVADGSRQVLRVVVQ
jgi:hypothetical protein